MKIRLYLATLFAAATFMATVPAFAADCDAEIAALDQALAGVSSIDAQTLAEVKYLRSRAAASCTAGDSVSATNFISQAKAVAGIQ